MSFYNLIDLQEGQVCQDGNPQSQLVPDIFQSVTWEKENMLNLLISFTWPSYFGPPLLKIFGLY